MARDPYSTSFMLILLTGLHFAVVLLWFAEEHGHTTLSFIRFLYNVYPVKQSNQFLLQTTILSLPYPHS